MDPDAKKANAHKPLWPPALQREAISLIEQVLILSRNQAAWHCNLPTIISLNLKLLWLYPLADPDAQRRREWTSCNLQSQLNPSPRGQTCYLRTSK